MKHDYRKLLAFIRKEFGFKKNFADFLGISNVHLSCKLSGKEDFTTAQIQKVQIEYGLTAEEVGSYFFSFKKGGK